MMATLNHFSHSDVESNRFGLNVYRGQVNEIDHEEILDAVIKNNIDVLIFRIPYEKQESLCNLEKTGLTYLIADTLVSYYFDLKKYDPPEAQNKDLEYILCTSEDYEILDKLISDSFRGYKNHYSSNPLLSVDLSEAYKEWAHNYVTDRDGKCTWLVKQNNQFIAFISCAFHDDECEIVLGGTPVSNAGHGVATDNISFAQRYFKNAGYSSIKIMTQVNNYSVQRAWSKAGFIMKQAYLTVHVNAMMNASVVQKKIFPLTITSSEIEKYGKAIADVNGSNFTCKSFHRDGFIKAEAPAFMINSIISKYYGMEFPGRNTSFIDYSYKFIKPIYLEKENKIEISFPFIDKKNDTYKSLVKVFDPDGELCLFSYYNLIKK